MSKLEVAVIGCGRMGTLRAHGAARWGATVATVFDSDAARAGQLAQALPGCRAAALSDGTIDWSAYQAVFVCTPPSERAAAHEAVRQRVPVFMEKPVGLRSEDAETMLADGGGDVITAVGYMNRYRSSIDQARQRLRENTVLGASAHWINAAYAVPWWSRVGNSGGSLNEQATHVIDLFRYLIGEPLSVNATATPHPDHPGIAGTAALTLEFADGVLATMMYSCRASSKAIGMRLFTAAGETVLQDWDFRLVTPDSGPPVEQTPAERNRIFDTETGAFLTAVSTGDRSGIRCDLRDALRTQRVLDAAGESLAQARACTVKSERET